jgi:RNA polymerase sigma factor (TIGR02999 family)
MSAKHRRRLRPGLEALKRILSVIEQDKPKAAAELLPLVYQALCRLATKKLAREPPGQTLDATALVHEAYLRLVDVERQQSWNSHGHFFAAAAEAMRRILVDNARKRLSLKHGGGRLRQPLHDSEIAAAQADQAGADVSALDEALDQLALFDEGAALVVKLRFFAGLTSAQAARALDISQRTAERAWSSARAFLKKQLQIPGP